MAEVGGLNTSISQIASTGIRLSTALCDLPSGVGRAEQETAGIADHVKTIAITLDGVARVLAQDDGANEVSKSAISEAGGLAKRCEAVFGDVQDFIEERNNLRQEQQTSRALEQSKEQGTELLRRRLDSLKHSIMLLLHVLQLANGQAKGNIENSVLAEERETIRGLHQRQQDSLKALQALEGKLGDVPFSDDETLNGSAAPSRVPTINFLVHSSARGGSMDGLVSRCDESTVQAPSASGDNPETSDSDDTVTDDDGEHLTVNHLARCANHVQKLSKRIAVLQQFCDAQSNDRFPRNRALKMYRRFCRKFESEMAVHESATPTTAPAPGSLLPPQKNQHVLPHEITYDPQTPVQHTSRILPDPSTTATDRGFFAQNHFQRQQDNIHTGRPSAEGQNALATPAWTISSEPLGPGSRPKLPPLISNIPRANLASPTNEMMSPADDQDAKLSEPDGDAEHGSHETGPIVYTKTGRISKAKKGLKVHVCEECGRSFTRAEHLRRHQKNHGPNQVRCELCGKVFFRADLLQRHLERHKDVPQGYRFSNAPGPSTESASPAVADEQHHRHILPAPGHATSSVLPHHSPSGRSVDSSGASGAPTPLEIPAVSSAVAPRPRSAWETANPKPVVPHAPEEKASQHPHGWQTVNVQDKTQHTLETTHAHGSPPSLQQQSHPGLPKLQPKASSANGASPHKRYSNILPALGASNAQNQHAAYPQGHIPNMVPVQSGVSAAQAVTRGPTAYHDPNQMNQDQVVQDLRAASLNQHAYTIPRSPTVVSGAADTGLPVHSVQGYQQTDTQSRTPPPLGTSPGHTSYNIPAASLVHGPLETSTGHRAIEDIQRSVSDIDSGKISSDKEGVNWRLAETDLRSYRKRNHSRTLSQLDGNSSGVDDLGGGPTAHRTPETLKRSHSASQSLSLVMPQDERDHALLGKSRLENPQLAEVMSPHEGPPARALSPSLVGRRSVSRTRTETSESQFQAESANIRVPASGNVADGPESPEPESPYSLASINRYIQNQGPRPGANQGEDLPVSSSHPPRVRGGIIESPILQISLSPCERCREYSIKCDGKMPACTACATTKYAGECSFATSKYYDDISAMTRHVIAEPRGQALQPHAAGGFRPEQKYESEEDLPSPYLKPHDKGQHATHIPNASLDGDHEVEAAQNLRKRKADNAQQEGVETDGKLHGRKRSKGSEGTANGKDIVDVLLKEWTVPVSS